MEIIQDHPIAHLSYITKEEQEILINLNLYGSLKGKPNKGPFGLPSLQGSGGGSGGDGGDGGSSSGGDSGSEDQMGMDMETIRSSGVGGSDGGTMDTGAGPGPGDEWIRTGGFAGV
jgi:hypothetical protein